MLKISLRPSRFLAAILIFAHAGAIALAVLVDIPLWLKVVAVTLLIIQCLLLACRQALLLGPDSALALEVSSDHQFSMQTRASGWSEYDVLGTTYVTPYLGGSGLHETQSNTKPHEPSIDLIRESRIIEK